MYVYIYVFKWAYAKTAVTVISYLSSGERLVAWSLRLGDSVVRVVPQWLSELGDAENSAVAQPSRLGFLAVPIWHWKPGRLLESSWSSVKDGSLGKRLLTLARLLVVGNEINQLSHQKQHKASSYQRCGPHLEGFPCQLRQSGEFFRWGFLLKWL